MPRNRLCANHALNQLEECEHFNKVIRAAFGTRSKCLLVRLVFLTFHCGRCLEHTTGARPSLYKLLVFEKFTIFNRTCGKSPTSTQSGTSEHSFDCLECHFAYYRLLLVVLRGRATLTVAAVQSPAADVGHVFESTKYRLYSLAGFGS